MVKKTEMAKGYIAVGQNEEGDDRPDADEGYLTLFQNWNFDLVISF